MKKWTYRILIVLFLGIFLCSAGALAWYFLDSRAQEGRYEELAQLKPSIPHTLPALPGGDVLPETQPEDPYITVEDPATGETVEILPGFAQLYNLNSDIIGWLTIPGVEVDYPVMHTPEEPQYYLRRNFDKKRQTRGCLFLDGAADPFRPSEVLTVYGHKMRDGTMFGKLDRYKKESFWQDNRYIYFDTLKDSRVYEIIGVFQTSVSVEESFSYHLYADCSRQAFEEYVAKVKDLCMYDTGITAQYGAQLLTLSTCDKTIADGRFVVVAKRVGN